VTLTDPLTGEMLGYIAAALVFLTFCMKTMISLRLVAIASNLAFILYAVAADLTPILVLHGLLLPLNLGRLIQLQLNVRAAAAAERMPAGEENFDWLMPHARTRRLSPGEVLFRKGNAGSSMFILAEGEIRLTEIGVTLKPGAILGEISLFSGDGRRTVSAEAIGPVRLGEVTERRVRELYFDDPRFAYSLIRIITRRLLENAAAREREPVRAAVPALDDVAGGGETKG
jgi:hypothetical protein